MGAAHPLGPEGGDTIVAAAPAAASLTVRARSAVPGGLACTLLFLCGWQRGRLPAFHVRRVWGRESRPRGRGAVGRSRGAGAVGSGVGWGLPGLSGCGADGRARVLEPPLPPRPSLPPCIPLAAAERTQAVGGKERCQGGRTGVSAVALLPSSGSVGGSRVGPPHREGKPAKAAESLGEGGRTTSGPRGCCCACIKAARSGHHQPLGWFD